MQTFLPYPNYWDSAKCLDNKRLGKQRVEAWQILRIITGQDPNSRWKNHPAVKMWNGYPKALASYGFAMCSEWEKRGFIDNMGRKFVEVLCAFYPDKFPLWDGDAKLYQSHQSNLLRKNPEYYKQFNWGVLNDLPYYWPKGE